MVSQFLARNSILAGMHADKLILMIASVELVGFTSDELILMITWPKIGRKTKCT